MLAGHSGIKNSFLSAGIYVMSNRRMNKDYMFRLDVQNTKIVARIFKILYVKEVILDKYVRINQIYFLNRP